MASQITLVLGGVRSGKSAYAEELAGRDGAPVVYLATGQATDDEMTQRILRHQERRPAHWQTVEEPLQPFTALATAISSANPQAVVLLDSVDVWIANLLLAHENDDSVVVEARALAQLDLLLNLCRQKAGEAILVSSEVGLSPVPPNRLGRHFQDLLGTVNQRIAAAADAVYLVVAGLPVRVKPNPGNQQ